MVPGAIVHAHRSEEGIMESNPTPVFERILVPLDGSGLAEQSLPFARAIGGPAAEYVLVHAVPPLSEEREWFLGPAYATVDEVQARAKAAAREGMLRASDRWLGERPHISLEIIDGEPAETILLVAERRDVNLIVLASHGRGATGRLVFGSVADRIAHVAPVPVMIVRPQDAPAELDLPRIERVLVPLDGSDLAATALPVATKLAHDLKVPVVLVQAVDVVERIAPYPGAYAPPPELVQTGIATASELLEETAASLRRVGVPVTTTIQVGPAFSTIADTAQSGDIVVMASHGRGGLRRWMLGSVAEKLVRSGPAPVMIVPVAGRGDGS
jgi:nucleotide-binding universal stress UspA family protein